VFPDLRIPNALGQRSVDPVDCRKGLREGAPHQIGQLGVSGASQSLIQPPALKTVRVGIGSETGLNELKRHLAPPRFGFLGTRLGKRLPERPGNLEVTDTLKAGKHARHQIRERAVC
jgi:hypothetical protein